MKTALRIALAPVMLAIRLMLGLVAFITSTTSSVLGLSVSLFGLLSVIEFFIGYWQNGIAFMVLAFLVSPIGLPAIATLLLNLLDHLIGFFEGLVCRKSLVCGGLCASQIAAFLIYGGMYGNNPDHLDAHQ